MKALSPIVSAIILIVAAVIGGTIAYQYFASTLSTLTSKSVVVVDQASVFDNKVVFVSVSIFSKKNEINLLGLKIICGSQVKNIVQGDPGLEVNGTTITYVSNTDICSNPEDLLISVVYGLGDKVLVTEPVKPILH